MNEIFAENKRLKAEVEKLISENMELMGVIRALRANAREDAAMIDRLQRECDEARELCRDLYSAGCDLRRFASAYANDYDEADGKEGALNAISDFYDASKNIAKILGEEGVK